MRKRIGVLLVIAGAILLVAALLLFLYNDREESAAEQNAEIILDAVQSAISARIEESSTTSQEAHDPPSPSESVQQEPEPPIPESDDRLTSAEQVIVEIDGYGYIGYISIPKLELELPILSDWDYQRLKLAPCRHFGSSKSDDLVIAAHNYKRHFGKLSTLCAGDLITFTDMNGEVNFYEVVKLSTLSPDSVDAVQNSGYDLVLYTCTYGGKTRVTVFCNRVQSEA